MAPKEQREKHWRLHLKRKKSPTKAREKKMARLRNPKIIRKKKLNAKRRGRWMEKGNGSLLE